MRIGTGLAGAVLLVCQSVAAANVYITKSAQAGSGTAQSACHKPAEKPAHGPCLGFCQTSITASDQVKPTVLAAPEWSGLSVDISPSPATESLPAAFSARPPYVKPPPLIIVYCRLHN